LHILVFSFNQKLKFPQRSIKQGIDVINIIDTNTNKMKFCKKNGCTKLPRRIHPNPEFCRRHGGGVRIGSGSFTRINAGGGFVGGGGSTGHQAGGSRTGRDNVKQSVETPVKKKKNEVGYFTKFRLNYENMALAERLYSIDTPKFDGKVVRRVIPLNTTSPEVNNLVLELTHAIIKQAQQLTSKKFPLTLYDIDTDVLTWMAAPGRSRQHTNGKIHRDQVNTDVGGCYHFLLLMHDIDNNGGGVRMWPNTTTTASNERCPTRSIPSDVLPQDLLGKKGDVCVFDQRLLHQSLANQTDQTTVKFIFGVHRKGLILDSLN